MENSVRLHPESEEKTRTINTDKLIVVPEEENIAQFFKENSEKIYQKLYDRIQHMINTEKEEVYVFVYGDRAYGLDREDTKHMLTQIIDYSSQETVENYELAQKAVNLKKQMNGC